MFANNNVKVLYCDHASDKGINEKRLRNRQI